MAEIFLRLIHISLYLMEYFIDGNYTNRCEIHPKQIEHDNIEIFVIC